MNPFSLALKFTRWAEGGYTVDDGGATNLGVTQATYDEYREAIGAPTQSVTLITMQEEAHLAFLFYWEPAHCGDMPLRLSVCHFDAAFNSGEKNATRFLQSALGVAVDGDYGPITAAAVHSANDQLASAAYLSVRLQFLQRICTGEPPTKRLNGYRNRIAYLKTYIQGL